MTAIQVETTYTTGVTLTAWASGAVTGSVEMDEVSTGLYQATLDDALGSVWYGFVGSSVPTTWDDHDTDGPVKVFDLRDGVQIGSSLIFTGQQPDRGDETKIVVYKDENTPVTVTLTTGSLTGLTLRFAIEGRSVTDVLVIENGSITRTATTFTVTIPTSITSTVANYQWSLRDVTTGDTVLLHGVLTVRKAASKDA